MGAVPWLWPEPQHTLGSFLIFTENGEGDRVSPLMLCRAKRQLLREPACGGRAFPPQLLLQDLVAQQIVVFGDFHLMSSVLSRHRRQMALVE